MGALMFIVLGAAGIASMRVAMERGDLDEAARQGMLAGPAVVESALASSDRAVQLAAIAAAPITTGRAELLDALARAASGPDRRVAIPAARAAKAIAIELSRSDRPDDLAREDIEGWRARWAELAARDDRWIELRVLALDTAAALDPGGSGVDLATALKDPDRDYRRAAVDAVPSPVPPQLRGALANAIGTDTSNDVALVASQVLCFDLPGEPAKPILDLLGPAGLQRIRTLVGSSDARDASAIRDAARCLAADKSPESAAALRSIKKRPRF